LLLSLLSHLFPSETFESLVPALLMGNTALVKTPRLGALTFALTMPLWQHCFPAGVVNIFSGSGRDTMTGPMKSGDIDVFAFIGNSKSSDAVMSSHPAPHRLRKVLGLEAKNISVVLPDADLEKHIDVMVKGALDFNGQRCTALKIFFVHQHVCDRFLKLLVEKVDGLKMGMPWEEGVTITPLAEDKK
jgi:glyceraldehyde-3-phosphate dehydrogenase (NADP+)